MKTRFSTALLLLIAGSNALAQKAAHIEPSGRIEAGYPTKKIAQEALKTAKEILVGDSFKDSGGCLYTVGAEGPNLVLIPVAVNGSRVCSDKR